MKKEKKEKKVERKFIADKTRVKRLPGREVRM